MTARQALVGVASCPHVTVEGIFERHASMRAAGLTSSQAGGRWGPPGAFGVLYLGRPRSSVVVEAYRHLVDDVEGMRPELVQPRRLYVVEVRVHTVLDLRSPEARNQVGLTDDDLLSEVSDYEKCWEIARAAHQLSLHGIIAPAATRFGETLALYDEHLTPDELPRLVREERWDRLPADPRSAAHLRIVRDDGA
jgi:RES domain-containing protein